MGPSFMNAFGEEFQEDTETKKRSGAGNSPAKAFPLETLSMTGPALATSVHGGGEELCPGEELSNSWSLCVPLRKTLTWVTFAA